MPFNHLAIGFYGLQILCMAGFWIRWRDRTVDPEIEETFLRTIMEKNERISELFDVTTMHVLDYDCEYQGIPDREEFPEFENKFFKFFNNDSNMTKGFFVFGDLESNATMKLTFETMPVIGTSRFAMGEPFYFFDVSAEINHNGVYEKVDIVNRTETLKRLRPFLMFM